VVVVKRTSYRRAVDEQRDSGRDTGIEALLRRQDPAVDRMLGSHREHEETLAEVDRALTSLGVRATWVRRAHAAFDPAGADLVVTVGGDGTLLAASHHVGSQPLLGINSAPSHSVGFFCAAEKGSVEQALSRALSGRMRVLELARMEVLINGTSVTRRVLNDALVCHHSPAATSSYLLEYGGRVEEQKSSGFWIGPAAGSTAAQRSAGGRILPLRSKRLQLVVREPYTPASERLRLTHLLVPDGHEVRVRCKMQGARMFVDGPHAPIDLAFGDVLVFRRSPESLDVLGLHVRRTWHLGPDARRRYPG
jgi:NAD+ kinase